MGAIQNSLNQILGSVAGAAVAATHVTDQMQKKQEEALLGKQQYHEAGAKLEENKQAQESANKAISEYKNGMSVEEANKLVETAGSSKEKKQAKALLRAANQRYTASEAAEHSLAILAEEEQAYKAMQERAAAKMKWGGMR